MIRPDYINKLYAGFLGMNIGIRLGAPVEPSHWDFYRIQSIYGDVKSYLKEYKTFAADDDANGPVFFLRGLIDNGVNCDFTAEMVGKAWLNYARNERGMFWWGGVGVSTEHTAYHNLKNGIAAPRSGSIEQNGLTIAEQIGGQIFVDTWGLIWPGRPEKAAEYAMKAASVSHDGNGKYGGGFIAACIAKAFVADSIDEIIDAGLSQIPADCKYAEVVNAVREYHRKNPEDFRSCMEYLINNWGYDKYPGVCHIIPNAGVCVLALLYGNGDFCRAVEIATMCGWDTDCNAGNVGTIAGVRSGLEGIAGHYREPVNDMIVLSGISGYLNILDIPTYVKELAEIAYQLAGEKLPDYIVRSKPGNILLDFELPGSTHGVRLSNRRKNLIRHSNKHVHSGKGSLMVLFEHKLLDNVCDVYIKPFFRRSDFEDERYSPVFSPLVYPGNKLNMFVYLEKIKKGTLKVTPYVRTAMRDEYLFGDRRLIEEGIWTEITYILPDTNGDQICELGLRLEAEPETGKWMVGELYIDDITVTGGAEYSIDTSIQAKEFGQVTPFSYNQCECDLKEGKILITSAEERCQAFTGNYYACDTVIEADVIPAEGSNSGLIIRGLGAERYYAIGFESEGRISIVKHDFGRTILAESDFAWENGQSYRMKAVAEGDTLSLWINGEKLLEALDTSLKNGMVGFHIEEGGSLMFTNIHIKSDT